jgi:hypothetical protein
MKLQELILAVKENKLPQEQLEQYHDQMSVVFAEMQMEMADLEKEEALFMAKDFGEKTSVADRKVWWKASTNGQRLIVLKRYSVATKELLTSLKTRTFRLLS